MSKGAEKMGHFYRRRIRFLIRNLQTKPLTEGSKETAPSRVGDAPEPLTLGQLLGAQTPRALQEYHGPKVRSVSRLAKK
jgi:hypothetical protein